MQARLRRRVRSMGEAHIHIADIAVLAMCVVLSVLLLVWDVCLVRKKVTDRMQIEVLGRCADFITKDRKLVSVGR